MNQKLACRGPGNGTSIYSGLRSALVRAGYTTLRGKEPSYEYGHPLAPVAFTAPTEHFDVQVGPSPRSRGLTYDLEFAARLPVFPGESETDEYRIRGGETLPVSGQMTPEFHHLSVRLSFRSGAGHEHIIGGLMDVVRATHAEMRTLGLLRRDGSVISPPQ